MKNHLDTVLFLYITLVILSTVLLVPLPKPTKLFIITQMCLPILLTSLFNRDKTFCVCH